MAETKNSKNSTKKSKTAKSTPKVIKEKIDTEQEAPDLKGFEQYANIQYFSRDLITLSAPTAQRRRKYTRKQIRTFMLDPFKNYDKLQDVSQYLKTTGGNYFRIIKYLSDILTFDYLIYPNGKAKMDNTQGLMKGYENAAKILEKMNIKYNLRWMMERLIENGEIYLYEIEDGKGIIYKELPPNFCRISAIDRGVYMYEVDLNKITAKTFDVFPVEIQTAYENISQYKETEGWYEVGDKGFAFNAIGNYTHGFPLLVMMFDDVMGLEDTKDLIEGKNKLDSIKLIHQKIPLDDNNEPVFDQDIAKIYHGATKKGLPDGVSITTNPLEITAIPFDKAANREFDSIERSERNIWNSSGISDMVFNNNKASGEALKRSIIADEMMMYPFLHSFANFINTKIDSTKFSISFLETSYFNRDDKIKIHKDMLAYGASRMHFLALQGYEPIQILNILRFEQEVLDIDKFMIPKKTSHTMTDDGDEGGRPTQEDKGEEVKDNTDVDRGNK